MLRVKSQSYMRYLFDHAAQKGWENILNYLEKKPGCLLLDLGCSDGNMTLKMAKQTEAQTICGVELDDEKIAIASKRGIIIYKADLNRELPIQSESVDIIVASQIIEHMINVDNFVKETYRILKHGGCAIIATENLASWHNIFSLLLGKQPYSGPYVSTEFSLGQHPLTHPKTVFKTGGTMEMAYIKHNTVMAYQTLKEVLKVYGFEIVGSKGSGYHPWPGKLSDALSAVDIKHSHVIVIKAKKA